MSVIEHKNIFSRMAAAFSETFGLSRTVSLGAVCFTAFIICFAIFWFIHSAPPRTLTITTGPAGGIFESNAMKYAAILARNGVKLKILSSAGSLENLQRLEDPAARVDIGFVQGGLTGGSNTEKLISLGSISYEPMLVFYRGTNVVKLLSDLAGKRVAIGPVGSGTRTLALTLLQANGIVTGGPTRLEDLDADVAAQALLAGSVDAVFLMSDSTSALTMRTLVHSPAIRLLSFEQADAYTRRFNYLNRMCLPEGSIDFGQDLPAQDVLLIGPTVELLARPDLNPALSDLLLEAAHEVHGHAGLFQNQGEFPAALEHEFKISPEADRYYKSGKSFLYRRLPFWIASLLNRTLVAFLPMVLVLIPALKLVPTAYKWRIQLRIYRWYRSLLVLERELSGPLTPSQQKQIVARLDEIEQAVNSLKVPASFASQFYGLREHVDYVRESLTTSTSA